MILIYLIVCAGIVMLDQWVKHWTVANIALGASKEFLPNFISLTYIRNTGAAWSLFDGMMVFFTIVTIVAVSVCLFLLIKNLRGFKFYNFALILIIAGALGNFIDRMRLGYVVDMFQTEFIDFPIFNVADMSLVVGVGMLFFFYLFEDRFIDAKHRKENPDL